MIAMVSNEIEGLQSLCFSSEWSVVLNLSALAPPEESPPVRAVNQSQGPAPSLFSPDSWRELSGCTHVYMHLKLQE